MVDSGQMVESGQIVVKRRSKDQTAAEKKPPRAGPGSGRVFIRPPGSAGGRIEPTARTAAPGGAVKYWSKTGQTAV